MRSSTELKCLGDLRTTISTHSRSAPRHPGSNYLDILSRGREKLRLETELACLARRQGRVERRLGKIRETMGVLLSSVEGETSSNGSPLTAPPGEGLAGHDGGAGPGGWRRMTIDY